MVWHDIFGCLEAEHVRSGGNAGARLRHWLPERGKAIAFQHVGGCLLADYDTSGTDRTTRLGLKVLALGGLPTARLGRYRVDAARLDSRGAAGAVLDARPDILLMDAAFVDPPLAEALARPDLAGLPVVLGTSLADAELAGLLLDAPLQFVPGDADADAVCAAVDAAAEGLQQRVADAGNRFDDSERIAALKRDAERVAAALAELAAGRPAAARPVDAARIRAHIKARRLRERFFAADMFADPAWDMLLDLAAARLEGRPVSVSSLCIAANVPTTTALRWIKKLHDDGLFLRSADPGDARRAFIRLSEPAQQAVDACLEAVLNQPGQ
jgi:hypothetical protein